MKLTVNKLNKLKEPGRYGDGHGLYLQVLSPTNRSWLFRYERGGKERWMGLGPVADFTLEEARERARRQRQLLRDGIDPLEARKAAHDRQRQEERENIDFKTAATEFLALYAPTWRNAKHRQQWTNTLEVHAYGKLGTRPVKVIDAAIINEVVAPLWHRTPETASRLRQRIERIVQWVKDGKPLPTANGARQVEHHAALPYADIPAFMAALAKREGIAARALEFTILTAARTSEVIGARWPEIDHAHKRWTIPAERIKAGGEHRVPLSDRALKILDELPREGDVVFIGGKAGAPLSNMAMAMLLKKRMGRDDITVHGFRSTFRDWAAERTSYPNHVVEMALAHAIGNKVEAAYRRGDLLAKRARLMAEWARYCYAPAASGATVTPIRSVQ